MSATPTVTSVLQEIFDDVGAQILISALSVPAPWLGAIFKIPIVGSLLTDLLDWGMNALIAAGVIEIKIGIISFMGLEACAKYASELIVLQQIQNQATMTPAQEAAFDQALQNAVANRVGIVNA